MRDPAGRTYGETFDLKGQARAWVNDEEARNRRSRRRDPRAGRQRFDAHAATWWEDRVVERTTADRDRSRMDSRVLPEWGGWPLDSITPSAVQAWVKRLQREGLSAWTVRGCVQLLASALETAVADGLIDDNPCRRVRLPAAPPGREVFLSRAEVDAIAEAMARREGAAEFDRAVLLLIAYTGLRWGEVSGLALPRVDLLRRRIDVTDVVVELDSGGFERKEYPKGARRRTVPIPRPIVPVLAEHIGRYPPYEDDLGQLLFRPVQLGYRWGRSVALSRHHWPRTALHPAAAAVFGCRHIRNDRWEHRCGKGVAPNLTEHDLRHTYASWLAEGGADLNRIRDVLGHGDIRTTQRYAHLVHDQFDVIEGALADPGQRLRSELDGS